MVKRALPLIAYTRVSTQKQGESGLGLEAQLSAINALAQSTGGAIAATYTEVESGRKSSRPELAKAIAHARRIKGRLVIGKLDRLARNVHFISGLMESKVDFVACDNPNANRLTIHILAAVAEDEAVRISQRTKAALEAAKARGVALGSARPGHWDGREDRRIAGAHAGGDAARKKYAEQGREVYQPVLAKVQGMRVGGMSLQEIADALNAAGHTTVRGFPWNKVQVSRLIKSVG